MNKHPDFLSTSNLVNTLFSGLGMHNAEAKKGLGDLLCLPLLKKMFLH